MEKIRSVVVAGLVGGLLIISAGDVVHAAGISGTISSTLTITEDTRLTGNVTCTVVGAPCIAFGAPGIALYLNGFTMTGLADANTGRSEEHTSELQSHVNLVCRLLLEKKKTTAQRNSRTRTTIGSPAKPSG